MTSMTPMTSLQMDPLNSLLIDCLYRGKEEFVNDRPCFPIIEEGVKKYTEVGHSQ